MNKYNANRFKIFLTWFLNLLIITAIFVLSNIYVTGWLERDNDRYVPGLGRYKVVSVLSDSMQPVMQAGDAIIVDSKAFQEVEEGDIVTYWRSNHQTLLTHRIIHVENKGNQAIFYTRGDANNVIDGNPVRQFDIVGKYLFCIPRGGYFIGFIHTSIGFVMLIMAPILLALLLEIRKLHLESKTLLRKKVQTG